MHPREENKLAEIQSGQSENVEVTLTLNGDTKHIQWNKQIPLLDALLNAGAKLRIPVAAVGVTLVYANWRRAKYV